MSTKLTLSIEEEIIQEAKEYAKSQGRSLSKIVSEYLKSLASKSSNKKNKELSKIKLCKKNHIVTSQVRFLKHSKPFKVSLLSSNNYHTNT